MEGREDGGEKEGGREEEEGRGLTKFLSFASISSEQSFLLNAVLRKSISQ